MNYLLVKEEQLNGQEFDYQYAERIPDGRIILPLSALKVLSNFTPEIISDDSLLLLIKQQQDSGLYGKPEEDVTDGMPGDDSEAPPATEHQPADETPVEEQQLVDNPVEEGGTA